MYFSFIFQARHHNLSVTRCFHFMLLCHISVTLLQLLASIFVLPPVVSSHHILWLLCVTIPLLSLTLMGNPLDTKLMTIALSKNNNFVTKKVSLDITTPMPVELFVLAASMINYNL